MYKLNAYCADDRLLGLSSDQLFVLSQIQFYLKKFKYCTLTNSTIAKNINKCKRTVQRHIDTLISKGLLCRKLFTDENKKTVRYLFFPEAVTHDNNDTKNTNNPVTNLSHKVNSTISSKKEEYLPPTLEKVSIDTLLKEFTLESKNYDCKDLNIEQVAEKYFYTYISTGKYDHNWRNGLKAYLEKWIYWDLLNKSKRKEQDKQYIPINTKKTPVINSFVTKLKNAIKHFGDGVLFYQDKLLFSSSDLTPDSKMVTIDNMTYYTEKVLSHYDNLIFKHKSGEYKLLL